MKRRWVAVGFLAGALVALLLEAYGGAALLVGLAGTYVLTPGIPRIALGPTRWDNAGRAMIVLGLLGFVLAVALTVAT